MVKRMFEVSDDDSFWKKLGINRVCYFFGVEIANTSTIYGIILYSLYLKKTYIIKSIDYSKEWLGPAQKKVPIVFSVFVYHFSINEQKK